VNRSEFARKLLEHPAQLLGAGGACRNIEQPASVRLAGKFDQADHDRPDPINDPDVRRRLGRSSRRIAKLLHQRKFRGRTLWISRARLGEPVLLEIVPTQPSIGTARRGGLTLVRAGPQAQTCAISGPLRSHAPGIGLADERLRFGLHLPRHHAPSHEFGGGADLSVGRVLLRGFARCGRSAVQRAVFVKLVNHHSILTTKTYNCSSNAMFAAEFQFEGANNAAGTDLVSSGLGFPMANSREPIGQPSAACDAMAQAHRPGGLK